MLYHCCPSHPTVLSVQYDASRSTPQTGGAYAWISPVAEQIVFHIIFVLVFELSNQ